MERRFGHYSLGMFRKDLISGIIVGVIAIPLGMAFAIASGVKPEYGIYTTIIAGILVSLLGGSRYQIAGPTGAFIPVLLGIVLSYGYENLLVAGLMAGVILLVLGLSKLGTLIRYVPRPVTIGFTAGIAIIIFTGQIANFLGLTGVGNHEHFLPKMADLFARLSTISPYSVLTAGISLALIILTQRLWLKIPGSLVGLLGSSLIAMTLYPDQIATIGSTYGAIPNTLPSLQLPDMTWERVQMLIGPALIIAMLGGIESLLSAVVADEMTNTKHNSNRELIGQGIANIVTPLFGGIPATGAIARTATNVKNGAVTRVSGIIHGLVVLLILFVFAPYASHIPLASMAPILMVVAWNMSERKHFIEILRTRTSDALVLVTTFLLTVFTDLTTAVGVGILLSIIIFVKRGSELQVVHKVLPDPSDKRQRVKLSALHEVRDCSQINISTIEGPLFFGSAQAFQHKLRNSLHPDARVWILRMGRVPYMDTSGAASLSRLMERYREDGGLVLITGMQNQPKQMLKKIGLYDEIGASSFYAYTGEAIQYALEQGDVSKCLGCEHFVFRECRKLSNGQKIS